MNEKMIKPSLSSPTVFLLGILLGLSATSPDSRDLWWCVFILFVVLHWSYIIKMAAERTVVAVRATKNYCVSLLENPEPWQETSLLRLEKGKDRMFTT